jgi:hypothetical protein
LTAAAYNESSPLNLLCPACHTPLPADADAVVTCSTCSAEVDVTRAGTISGRPRFVPEIDRTGSDVGGHHIEARLGGGGMGTVYRAIAADGTVVALKFLAPSLADNPDVVARFAREIVMLSRLDHPAIVRVLAHGRKTRHRGSRWRWLREATCARASRAERCRRQRPRRCSGACSPPWRTPTSAASCTAI